MGKIGSAFEILLEHGPQELIKISTEYTFNRKIWPVLPTTSDYGTYNQVEVKGTHPMKIQNLSGLKIEHRLLDNVVPWDTPSSIPNFKKTNVEQIHNNFNKGDTIVIVGGGNGVSAVHSARKVGPHGSVIIYEGDRKRIRDVKKTLKHNDVYDICDINHSVVGEAYHIESPGSASLVHPSNLPECDAIEMDCEGAELNILENIEKLPNKIVVELHHNKSFTAYSSTEKINSILVEKGYSVQRYDGPWVDGLFVAHLE